MGENKRYPERKQVVYVTKQIVKTTTVFSDKPIPLKTVGLLFLLLAVIMYLIKLGLN